MINLSYTEHYLFNLETAVASLALVITIYIFLLEKRFRVRMAIKEYQMKIAVGMLLSSIAFALIGSILPYIPGESVLIFGYPIVWEFFSFILYGFAIIIFLFLREPIRILKNRQIDSLKSYAAGFTDKNYDTTDLFIQEITWFWKDFLKKTMSDVSLKSILEIYISEKHLLMKMMKSQNILIETINFISKESEANNSHINNFFRQLVFTSLEEDDSIISEDLASTYKGLTQYIIREKKLADAIFSNKRDFPNLRYSSGINQEKILNRFVDLLELYLGRKYHISDKGDYIELIADGVLNNFFKYFKDNLSLLDSSKQILFLDKLFSINIDLEKLPKEQSETLANGIFEILVAHVLCVRNDNFFNSDRIIFSNLRGIIRSNEYSDNKFKQKLIEVIAGSKEEKHQDAYNLNGHYPMMIPLYLSLYGYEIFYGDSLKKEDGDMHLTILSKMREVLPVIARGELFVLKKAKESPRSKEESLEYLNSMFPSGFGYSEESNSIFYCMDESIFPKEILLDDTVENGKIVCIENSSMVFLPGMK